MTTTSFLFKPGEGVDLIIWTFSKATKMTSLELKPVHVSVVELNPFLFHYEDISIAKIENAVGYLKTHITLRMLKPELEIKVLVVDSDTIIEGFNNKELL